MQFFGERNVQFVGELSGEIMVIFREILGKFCAIFGTPSKPSPKLKFWEFGGVRDAHGT